MRIILYVLLILFFSASCKKTKKSSSIDTSSQDKEILIYCENAMVPALMELKTKFETNLNCKIKLHNDCSQNLSSLIRYSLKGDIYFPASRAGFLKLKSNQSPFIIDSVFVGYNPLVVMTAKGNPSGYNGDFSTLAQKKHAVIIANPETSSLGHDTRILLKKNGLYDDVILNVVALSTDSRGLVKSLKNKEAQLVVNWKCDIYNNGNIEYAEVFPIPEIDQSPSEIYAGILSTSNHPQLARQFLDYAIGEEGISIFRKYGFNRRKTLIF
ncbi:molybdate ABC transporter substrate-binding protein [Labilibacter sediminis]|nr:molybdate ABC transporter substrate-binding protein [Labilibacter sediminis]